MSTKKGVLIETTNIYIAEDEYGVKKLSTNRVDPICIIEYTDEKVIWPHFLNEYSDKHVKKDSDVLSPVVKYQRNYHVVPMETKTIHDLLPGSKADLIDENARLKSQIEI